MREPSSSDHTAPVAVEPCERDGQEGFELLYLTHHILERAAAGHPDKEAIVDRDRRVSYRRFLADARSVATVLRAHGLTRGDRVAIFLGKSYEEAAAIFATSIAGGVFVPVNSLLRPAQVRHILADCEASALVTTAAAWKSLATTVSDLESLSSVLIVDGAPDPADPRLAAWIGDGSDEAGGSEAIGEDLAAILYTSGSTGLPKGVMLSHRNLLAGSRIVCEYVGIEHDERILSVLPFSFDYGLNQLLTGVEKVATVVLLSFRFGKEIVRALVDERISGLAGVPTVWVLLTQATPGFFKTGFPDLRYVTNSGGAVPPELLADLRRGLPDTRVILMYGLTEAFRSTYLPPEELDRRPTSVGKAIPETEIFLVDESGRRCAQGETGILVHRGPTVSMGYWRRPEETAAVFRSYPLTSREEGGEIVCVSGDLVRSDEEGYFYFVARNDAMIKCSGYRISPNEVEAVLMRTGRIAHAAVIGLPDPASGERVHALVVAGNGVEPDPEPLLAQCARELPAYMVPREIEFVTELPRTSHGKVDYPRLRREQVERQAAV